MSHAAKNLEQATGAFSKDFVEELSQLFSWRRDVRRFTADPVPQDLLCGILQEAANVSPSVGLSQPARFVLVEKEKTRGAVLANFADTNKQALEGYEGEQKQLYATLKLSGMQEAPVQIAAFCDEATLQGSGLGSATMPETLRYSVVCAIMQFWLATRAEGLGLGWVSILDPARLKADLGVKSDWAFIGYLCVGWPEDEHLDPELERAGWENRRDGDNFITRA